MARWRSPLCPSRRRGVRVSAAALAALLLCLTGFVFSHGQASAQEVETPSGTPLHFTPRPPPPPKKPPPPSNQPMLVQATEIRYDYTNNSVAAVGNVQI